MSCSLRYCFAVMTNSKNISCLGYFQWYVGFYIFVNSFFAKLRAFFTKFCILQICNKIKVTFCFVFDFFTNNSECFFYCFVSKHSGEILLLRKYEKVFREKKKWNLSEISQNSVRTKICVLKPLCYCGDKVV